MVDKILNFRISSAPSCMSPFQRQSMPKRCSILFLSRRRIPGYPTARCPPDSPASRRRPRPPTRHTPAAAPPSHHRYPRRLSSRRTSLKPPFAAHLRPSTRRPRAGRPASSFPHRICFIAAFSAALARPESPFRYPAAQPNGQPHLCSRRNRSGHVESHNANLTRISDVAGCPHFLSVVW